MPTRKAKEDEANVHLMLDRKLWLKVRTRALQEGTTAVEIVRQALQEFLSSKGRGQS